MVTLRKSPERRQSLIGSERLTRTSQLPRFHGHVLGNGDAPQAPVWVCASKGWLSGHEFGHLPQSHEKSKKFHRMDAQGSRYLWPGPWAHHESTWQCPARNIQAGNKSHHCLLGHPLHGLLKAYKQQEGNYSLFGPCHGTTLYFR